MRARPEAGSHAGTEPRSPALGGALGGISDLHEGTAAFFGQANEGKRSAFSILFRFDRDVEYVAVDGA
jgi:hypothetical protein